LSAVDPTVSPRSSRTGRTLSDPPASTTPAAPSRSCWTSSLVSTPAHETWPRALHPHRQGSSRPMCKGRQRRQVCLRPPRHLCTTGMHSESAVLPRFERGALPAAVRRAGGRSR
jgi:hypothetical protein